MSRVYSLDANMARVSVKFSRPTHGANASGSPLIKVASRLVLSLKLTIDRELMIEPDHISWTIGITTGLRSSFFLKKRRTEVRIASETSEALARASGDRCSMASLA